MSTTNQQTLQTYNDHVQDYIDGTPQQVSGKVQQWIDDNLAALSTIMRILEIGSAFNRDADYIEGKGFHVERTDASSGFVEYLHRQGCAAKILNVITDNLDGPYDMIFANAVLLHFTREEVQAVIKKVFEALTLNGRFVLSIKRGDGEETEPHKMNAPRYFCYWQPEAMEKLLRDTGFVSVQYLGSDPSEYIPHPFLLFAAIRGQKS